MFTLLLCLVTSVVTTLPGLALQNLYVFSGITGTDASSFGTLISGVTMRFQVLGPLQVTVGDEALALGAPQQQKLLAVLCATPNKPISSDRLIDEIWGDNPPPSAHHLVQVYVSGLRRVLGELDGRPRVSRGSAGYQILVDENEIDSLRLAVAVEEAEQHGDQDPAAVWQILGEATDLWRGAPFGELADESDTLRLTATRLSELYVRAMERRIDAGLELGYHPELIADLDELVAVHPYRERPWQQLMIALYRCGRQAEALRAYRTLRTKLGEDLGIEPGVVTSELEARILLNDRELFWEPPPPPSNLPADLSTFVGRAAEVSIIAKLLDTTRLVTLTGPGGIGKTRLAIETGRRLVNRYPDGVWWIDLAPLTSEDAVLPAVARALRVSSQPDKTTTESVIQSLMHRKALLVVDNCEHVVAGVAEFSAAALRAASHIRILATSRVPLHISGESLWIVPSLSMPEDQSGIDGELPYCDAVQLFVERGAAIAPFFRLDNDNADEVVELCRRLDGLPLAIEMAAARLRVLSPGEIAGALGSRFEVLAHLDRAGTARHESLEAALEWSYDLLERETQTAFDNLAVFPESFDLNAADEIAFSHVSEFEPRDTMSALVEASMVATVGIGETGMRFRLLETLREYGASNLRQAGRFEFVIGAHAAHFVSLFKAAAGEVGEPGFVRWMRLLDDCYADVRQAIDWSLQSDHPAEAMALAPPLVHYWYRTGDAREALFWGTRMLEAASRVSGELAAAHAAVAFGMTVMVEDPAAAIFHADRAIELYRTSPDRRGLVFGLFGRANAALLVGDAEAVRSNALEGLALADEIGFSWGRGVCLSMLAFSDFFGGGSVDEARGIAVEAALHLRAAGDVGSQVIMNPLAAIALSQGDLDSAERYALDTAGIAVGSGWEAAALDTLAQVHIAKGDFDRAEETLRRAVLCALDSGLENWFRMALRDLARVACHRTDAVRAAKLAGASRRNLPAWALDQAVYDAIENECIAELGEQAFGEISLEGYQLGIEQLLDLAIKE